MCTYRYISSEYQKSSAFIERKTRFALGCSVFIAQQKNSYRKNS